MGRLFMFRVLTVPGVLVGSMYIVGVLAPVLVPTTWTAGVMPLPG
jgi:hypothetical protein